MEVLQEIKLNSINWYTFSKSELRKVFNEDYKKTLVKQNPLRTITALHKKENGAAEYFIKHDHARFWEAKLKGLFRSKVKKEFESANLLLKHSITCVNYIAWGERGFEGFLLTEAFRDSQDLNECWQEIKHNPLLRKNFIAAFTNLIAKTLDAKVFHPDLHIGNILVRRQGNEFVFKYVDVYGVKQVHKLSIKKKLNMLVILLWLYHDLSPFELNNLFSSFTRFFPFTKRELRQKIINVWSRRVNHFRARRRKKLLKQSSQINFIRTKEGIWRTVKDIKLSDTKKLLEKHREIVSNTPDQLIKNDKKRRLSRVVLNDKSFIVKEFYKIRCKGRFSPDRRSWLNASGLKTIGIPACRYLAWLHSNQSGYVVLEDLGQNLIHYEFIRIQNNPDRLKLLLM